MLDPSDFIVGCIIAGLLLIVMTLAGSFIAPLPLSAAMLYLGASVPLGPILAPTDPVLASDAQVGDPGEAAWA
jgi:NhaP-type Na+/H+ or K+/H+ antiporter